MTAIQKSDGGRRILWRFLRLIIPAFVIAVSVSLYFATNFTFGNERVRLAKRIENLTWHTAVALNTLSHDKFAPATQPLLSLLLADPAVSCAIVVDKLGNIISSVPTAGGCAGVVSTAQADMPLNFPVGGRLYIKYNFLELEARNQLLSFLPFSPCSAAFSRLWAPPGIHSIALSAIP